MTKMQKNERLTNWTSYQHLKEFQMMLSTQNKSGQDKI